MKTSNPAGQRLSESEWVEAVEGPANIYRLRLPVVESSTRAVWLTANRECSTEPKEALICHLYRYGKVESGYALWDG